MPVKGDDIWNSVMSSVEQDAGQELQGQADQELQRREGVAASLFPDAQDGMDNPDAPFTGAAGRALVTGAYRAKDAINAAGAGVLDAPFQFKDFLSGLLGNAPPTPDQMSETRRTLEQTERELRALSKWNGAVEGIANFVTGFAGTGLVAKGGQVVNSVRAAVTGATMMDPTEERLSNLIQSYPYLQNPVTEFLAAKPDDSRAMGRLKNAVESITMDAVAATAMVAGARVIKAMRAGDKAAADAAMKELDAANVKLAQQEAEHYRKSFIDEQTTADAQAQIEQAQIRQSGAVTDDQAPGMTKQFGGQVEPPAGQPPGLGGRAEALDREMRQSPDMPEVPGAGPEADVPSGQPTTPPAPTEKPFGGGGMAEALDREMRGNGEVPPTQATPVPAQAGAGGEPAMALPPDARTAASVSGDVRASAPQEGVANVTPEAKGARKLQPPALPEVTPEQVQKMVARASKDDAAVEAAGSVEAALQDGHKFGGAGTIPWQKLEAPGATRQFIADMVDLNQETVRAAKGGDAEGILRDTKVDKLATQMGRLFDVDPQMILGQLKAAGDNARMMTVQMETGFRLANRAFLDNYEFLRRVEAGNLMGHADRASALEEFRQRTMVAMDLYSNARSLLSNAGRTMRRAREEFKIRADQMQAQDIAKMDPELLAGLFRATEGDPVAMAKAARPGFIKQVVDGVNLFRMANILSGPTTQIVNMVSNAAMMAFRPLTTYTGAAMREAFGAMTQNEVMSASARAMRTRAKVEMISTASTIQDGLGAFKKAWLLGDSLLNPHNSSEVFDSFAMGTGSSQELPWRDFKTIDDVIANGIKAISYVTTADLRLMGAADEMVKTMRYRGVLMGRAAVEADERGLKPGSKAYIDLLKQRADEGFDANGRAIDASALQEAKVTTFQQDLKLPKEDTWGGLNTLGSTASNFINNWPVAKLIVPFIKTPANLFRYGVKLTPGLNLLQKEYVNSLRGMHGDMAQATAMGEMAMGILLLSAGAQLRLADKITGSGPADPKQSKEWKAQGNMPYAVRIGDKNMFQINRFDPVQMPVALAADFVDMFMMHQNKGDMEDLENVATGMVLALAHQLKDKTYYKGASDFLDALGDDKKVKSWGERFVPGLIPGVSLLRHVNPDPYVHEVNGLVDSIKSNIPGYSETVPVRYDALGRPVMVPGRFVGEKDFDNPVTRALDQQFAMTGTTLSAPQPRVDGIDLREITLEKNGKNAFEEYNKLIAKPKGTGVSLEKALERIVGTQQYAAAPHGDAGGGNTKEYMVANVINSYRKAALDQLKAEHPDLRATLGKKAQDTYNKAMAGQKDLKSVEANSAGKQLNALLAQRGFGPVMIPQVQPAQQ